MIPLMSRNLSQAIVLVGVLVGDVGLLIWSLLLCTAAESYLNIDGGYPSFCCHANLFEKKVCTQVCTFFHDSSWLHCD